VRKKLFRIKGGNPLIGGKGKLPYEVFGSGANQHKVPLDDNGHPIVKEEDELAELLVLKSEEKTLITRVVMKVEKEKPSAQDWVQASQKEKLAIKLKRDKAQGRPISR